MARKISFIGVGNMATAILTGITSRQDDPVAWSDIILFNRHTEKIQKYAAMGATIAGDLYNAVSDADIIMLCVKPQNFPEILSGISTFPGMSDKLFVTIAAGISADEVSSAAHGAGVVRAMPNTPMLIGCGVTAICRNAKVSDDEYDFVCKMFASSGKVFSIQEKEMNRIICVSGSSPAYVFMIIKAMYQGAVEQGLLRETDSCAGLTEKELINVICDTIIGSATLMKNGEKTPDEQIRTVCSKGGTTERAISELEDRGIYEAFSSAMRKCSERAEELGAKNK